MIKKKILLIDDDKDFCDLMKIHLEAIGNFDVQIALNGRDGIRDAKKMKPDLILLDILMPGGMSGLETIEKLKKDPATMQIPVAMLTAKGDELYKTKAAQLYNEVYITKPIDAKELKAKIEDVFRRGGKV